MDNEKQSIEELDFTVLHWSHQQRAELFLGDFERPHSLSIKDQNAAQSYATDFEDDGEGKPMAQTAVLIPVAVAQDSGLIHDTLREYAKQKGNDPFTIFLSLNAATDQGDMVYDTALEEVNRARRNFPQLDIRTTMPDYETPRIGAIRRDLWNAAFMLAYNEGNFEAEDGDVIGINNDIDTTYISPHYIARIQQHYKRKRARYAHVPALKSSILHPTNTRLTHAISPNHPHVGMVTKWVDNTYFQQGGSYEAGMVIPFMHYAINGGFNAEDVIVETRPFQNNDHTAMPLLTGAQLYTSPRRYINRLAEGFTENEIWDDESFSHNDACRDELKPDITRERAEYLILERLEHDITNYWMVRPLAKYTNALTAQTFDKTFNQKNFEPLTEQERDEIWYTSAGMVTETVGKAARLMEKVVGSAALAAIIRENYDTNSLTYSSLTWSIANYVVKIANQGSTRASGTL